MSALAGLLVLSAGRAALGRAGLTGLLASDRTAEQATGEGDEGSCTASGQASDSGQDQGDQGQDEGTSDEGDQGQDEGTSDQCDSSSDQPDPAETPQPDLAPSTTSGDREAACTEAAGMTQGGTPQVASGAEAPTAKKKGLDNAIDRVMANCVKNPDAPGLLNALRHLVANRERHLAHEAEKADRKAAHEATKAEHGAHGKGHGGD